MQIDEIMRTLLFLSVDALHILSEEIIKPVPKRECSGKVMDLQLLELEAAKDDSADVTCRLRHGDLHSDPTMKQSRTNGGRKKHDARSNAIRQSSESQTISLKRCVLSGILIERGYSGSIASA